MKESDSENTNEDYSSDQDATESSSEDEEIVDLGSDKDFFKTLSCLKNKDPRIYDENIQFFTKPIETAPKGIKNENNEKSVFVKDYVVGKMEEESDEETDRPKQLTYAEEQQATKQFFKSMIENNSNSEDENDDSFLKVKVKTDKVKKEEEADYIQFLKGNKAELEDKEEEKELKPLQDFWNKKDLDENEEFLKDYILNRRYLETESAALPLNEDLSEDERQLEDQAEFEMQYNRRYETGENLEIKRFPRKVEGSLRRKDDSRKKKRAEVAQRKKEEKTLKHQEIKKKQKEKLFEIEERLQRLKEFSGNPELTLKEEEILEDFDPAKHDKRMNDLFNEDYYNQEEDEHPSFNEDDYNWDYENINMDCEANDFEEGKKLTRSQKKKLKKKKAYADIMDIVKPSFDPTVHNSFKEYFDEYYSLDCEDFIDDLPCKFKYREVVPNDYGLTIEEILMADDSELNQWASVKKICKRRPEHVEKNEVKIYSKKARDENLKKKILKSLYSDENNDLNEGENVFDNKITVDNSNAGDKKRTNKTKSTPVNQENNVTLNPPLNESSNLIENHSNQGQNKTKNGCISIIKSETESRKKKKRKRSGGYEINEVENSETNPSIIEKSDTANRKQCSDIASGNEKSQLNHTEIRKVKKQKTSESKTKCNLDEGQNNIDSLSQENKFGNNNRFVNVKNKRKKKQSLQLNNSGKVDPKNKITNNSNKVEQSDFSGNRLNKKKRWVEKSLKNRKSGDVTELSDNRLRAYGMKPRQFRAKIKYSKKKNS